MLIQVSVTMIRALNSLESHENKLQPEPGQREHDDHVWEGKAKPGGKVDHVSILRKQSEQYSKREWNMLLDKIVNIGVLLWNEKKTLTGSSGPWAPGWDQFPSVWRCLRCWQRNKHKGSSLYTFYAFLLTPYAWPPPLRHLRKSPPLGLHTRIQELQAAQVSK